MIRTLAKWMAVFGLFVAIACVTAYSTLVFIVESPPPVVVPELVGKDVVTVLETLSDLGLVTDMGELMYHDAIPKYHITYQHPPPGSEIKTGRHVRINISAGVKRLQLPDLTGLPLERAMSLLDQLDMTVDTVSRTAHRVMPAGSVICQSPQPGRAVDRRGGVDLLLSTGPMRVLFLMPDLMGMSVDSAALQLEQAGLRLGNLAAGEDHARPHNSVLHHEPPPGYPVAQGAVIDLVVNRIQGGDSGVRMTAVRGGELFIYRIRPGFLKKHVRLVLSLYGQEMEMVDDYFQPGHVVRFLVPHAWVGARIQVFENDERVEDRVFFPE